MQPDKPHGSGAGNLEDWFNRGVSHLADGQYAAAEKCFRSAAAMAPDVLGLQLNLGYALDMQGRFEEALCCYEYVLEVDPQHPKALYNSAVQLLRSGNLAAGFEGYESRFAALKNADSRIYTQPRWDGLPLNGRSLLVYCEQGLGDAIQFSRYIPGIVELGGQVVLEAQQPLVPLLSTLPGIKRVVLKSGVPPITDCHIPLLSLPHIFGTTLDTVPAPIPYLVPDPSKVKAWRQMLAGDIQYKIGLVWRGSATNPMDRDRSCPLAMFAPLLAISGVSCYSLQVGPAADEITYLPQATGLTDLTEHLDDFSDTAALLANLDLIISVDTSVAHLAGALGIPVWVLLAYKPDWRWMSNRNDSPWYPSMRLFRQPQPGDWHSVVIEIVRSLEVLMQQVQAIELTEEKQADLFQSALQSLETSDPAAAIRNLRMLLGQDGDDPAIWFNLGRAYDMSIQLTEAELCYRQALVQKPDSAAIWCGLAYILLRCCKFAQAEVCLHKACLYAPESTEALLALNASLIAQNKTEETLQNSQKILLLKPGCSKTIFDISYAQLCQGNYLDGFANFESRLLIEEHLIDPRIYTQPRWDGSPLMGKSILVFGEQGMGDVLHFSRYLPLVAERGGEIIFEVPLLLISVFTGMPYVKQVLARSKIPPQTDCYIQLMSLPYIFSTTIATIPDSIPYLGADPAKVALWRHNIPNNAEFRVGLVWRGNSSYRNDTTRSCPLEEFTPLADLRGVCFYSLQVGAGQNEVKSPPNGMQLVDLTKQIDDFSDTAALIANLDLVIGVDTAVIHLAGALGKPVWVLLSHFPEWRWLVNENTSPWYPSMRLFRQEQVGDWRSAIMLLKHKLELLLAERAR